MRVFLLFIGMIPWKRKDSK